MPKMVEGQRNVHAQDLTHLTDIVGHERATLVGEFVCRHVVFNGVASSPRPLHGGLESAWRASEDLFRAQVRFQHCESGFGPRLEVSSDLFGVVRAHWSLAVHADLVTILTPEHLINWHAIR